MITSETPYKLAEIIRETWPGLYRPLKISSNIKVNGDEYIKIDKMNKVL